MGNDGFACLLWGYFACCSDDADEQLQFQALQALDNPEHHMRAIAYARLYKRANALFQSIQFRDLTLQDLLRADGRRAACILSALINFLHHRKDRIDLLEPIIQEYGALEERQTELKAKTAEVSFPSSFFTFFLCLLSGKMLKLSLSVFVCVFFSAFPPLYFLPCTASEGERGPSP